MVLLVEPWTIRNYVIHKQLIPICTTMGELLWRGNNPLATGTAYSANGTPIFFSAPMEFQNKIASLDEIGQMRAFREEAFRYIREKPAHFIHRVHRGKAPVGCFHRRDREVIEET